MTSARRRGLVLVVAALALAFAGSAEAKKKKKKAVKHHKTPSGKTVGKSKGKPVEAAPEPEESSDTGAGKKEEEEFKAPPAKAPPAAVEVVPEGETPSGGQGEGEGAKPPPKKRRAAVPEAEAEAAPGTALPALELLVGAGALFRNLAWNQNMSPTAIVPYSLAPGPEAIIALETYPAAFATPGFAGNIGLFGHFDYGFGVVSKQGSQSVTTKFQDYLVGLKLRIPLGTADPYVSVAYGGQAFRLEGLTPLTVPGVSYSFIRGGLGARVHFGRTVDLDVGGGYLYVNALGTSTGDIASTMFFPKAAGYAVDAGLSLGLRVTQLLALRVGYDFRQYGLTLHQAQGVQPVVGGAADRYMTAWGGVELVFDGIGGGGSGSAEDEAAKPAPPPAAKQGKPRRQPEPDLSDDAGE